LTRLAASQQGEESFVFARLIPHQKGLGLKAASLFALFTCLFVSRSLFFETIIHVYSTPVLTKGSRRNPFSRRFSWHQHLRAIADDANGQTCAQKRKKPPICFKPCPDNMLRRKLVSEKKSFDVLLSGIRLWN
jgi:hypothetical protein